MADRATRRCEQPADVRERLVRVLAAGLTAAWDAAVGAGGAPGRLADIVDHRRYRLASAPPGGDAVEG